MPSKTENWKHVVDSRGTLKEVLIATAKAISDDDLLTAEWLMSELHHMVSISCEPIQRFLKVKFQNLHLNLDEGLALNLPFMLHHMPDESVDPKNKGDRLFRLVKSWSPRVMAHFTLGGCTELLLHLVRGNELQLSCGNIIQNPEEYDSALLIVD
ncbi:hypothetical protein Cgig2_001564 [Carnegiea gigantea]|uniref:Uncharacterized protein n=1 Tax=Carnegiea gigantea TaxID=171969 RepID=A0A9Q1JVN4_9CARY|nr:hypothetical protein Cgig2_001564 [Carnegiea gigantea]